MSSHQNRVALAQQIIDSRFSISRFRPGYKLRALDDFIDQIAKGLRSEEPIENLVCSIEQANLPKQRWSDSYDLEQVDAFLTWLAARLREI